MLSYYPTKEWLVRQPEEVKLDPKILNEADLAMQKIPKTLSFVVVKDGYIAYEKYYHGANSSTDLSLMSVTKSINSALTGIALDMGFIKSLDQPIIDFFPDYKLKKPELNGKVTIKHLLTFTTGMFWTTKANSNEPLFARAGAQKDWIDFVLNLPIANDFEIGRTFQYNTSLTCLLAVLIGKVAGMKTIDFAQKYLFEPLGIDYTGVVPFDYQYDPIFNKNMRMPTNEGRADFCLNLKARDLAKFGLLYLNQGKWECKQLISENYITQSTTNYGHNYGFMWDVREKEGHKIIERFGLGGQRLYIVPDFNLVAVINSKTTLTGPYPTHIMDEYVLKSCKS